VDFGLAKMLPASGVTYTLCGTADYMAPEILTHQGHGPAVDLWAVRASPPPSTLAKLLPDPPTSG
jgi:serine/threonine protein kinase